MSNHAKRDHVVDHKTNTVYLQVNSWSGAMAAPFWTKKYYPGFTTKLVKTPEQLQTLKENL